MLALIIMVVLFVSGLIVSIWLTGKASEHFTPEAQAGWRTRMLDESNYTEEGKRLRLRAMRFINGYMLAFAVYFVLVSHVLSCHGHTPR
jgi:hypothetical protein